MHQADQVNSFRRVRDVMEQDFDFLVELRDLTERETPSGSVSLAGPKYERQTIRRLYVRTLVSLIESVVATLKQDALDTNQNLSIGEKLLLSEQVFDLNDRGESIERPFIAPLPKSLKFAFRCFAKSHGLTRVPDYSGEGWRHFQELVRIRNRLTHPRSVPGLEVTDAEVDVADRAEYWFRLSNVALLDEYNEKLRAENAGLKAQMSRQEAGPNESGHVS